MKHPINIKGYNEIEDCARAIADLRYDKLAQFLESLSNHLHKDGVKDGNAGRTQLGKALNESSYQMTCASDSMKEIWDLCEPHMKKNGDI